MQVAVRLMERRLHELHGNSQKLSLIDDVFWRTLQKSRHVVDRRVE